jgi:hypothetical protein
MLCVLTLIFDFHIGPRRERMFAGRAALRIRVAPAARRRRAAPVAKRRQIAILLIS